MTEAPAAVERALPADTQTERSILGAVLLDNQALTAAAQILSPDDFFKDANRLIYEAMAWLSERSEAIDTVTLRAELERRDVLELAGGAAYLSSLIDGLPVAANVERYARIIRSAAQRRELARLGERVVDTAMASDCDTTELIEEARQALEAVGEDSAGSVGRRVELLSAADIEPARIIWTWAGRLPAGELALLAGEPGVGKGTVTTWLAARITRGDLPGDVLGTPRAVILASAEDDPRHTVVPRLLAVGADLERVQIVRVTQDGLTGALTLPDDVAAIRAGVEAEEAALLVVDPIGAHLGAEVDSHRDASVRRALAPLSVLAQETGAVVLAVAHLRGSSAAVCIGEGDGVRCVRGRGTERTAGPAKHPTARIACSATLRATAAP